MHAYPREREVCARAHARSELWRAWYSVWKCRWSGAPLRPQKTSEGATKRGRTEPLDPRTRPTTIRRSTHAGSTTLGPLCHMCPHADQVVAGFGRSFICGRCRTSSTKFGGPHSSRTSEAPTPPSMYDGLWINPGKVRRPRRRQKGASSCPEPVEYVSSGSPRPTSLPPERPLSTVSSRAGTTARPSCSSSLTRPFGGDVVSTTPMPCLGRAVPAMQGTRALLTRNRVGLASTITLATSRPGALVAVAVVSQAEAVVLADEHAHGRRSWPPLHKGKRGLAAYLTHPKWGGWERRNRARSGAPHRTDMPPSACADPRQRRPPKNASGRKLVVSCRNGNQSNCSTLCMQVAREPFGQTTPICPERISFEILAEHAAGPRAGLTEPSHFARRKTHDNSSASEHDPRAETQTGHYQGNNNIGRMY